VGFRYDPYNRVLTLESYDQVGMRAARRAAISAAAGVQHWGLVLGTLGRQGNPRTAVLLQQHLGDAGKALTTVLLSELSPAKLAAMDDVQAWVQVACPRLSIDWGEGFTKPTLTPFEAMVALGVVPGWWEQEEEAAAAAGVCGSNGSNGSSGGCCAGGSCKGVGPYPMDYYARGGGDWNSSYHKPKQAVGGPVAAAAAVRRVGAGVVQ
jgi:2-(3-amino-3-carboxypropyl)histidine synthase